MNDWRDNDKNKHESYKAVVASKEEANLLKETNKKMQSLKKNESWDLVSLPKGGKAVGCNWIFKRKKELLVMNQQGIRHG